MHYSESTGWPLEAARLLLVQEPSIIFMKHHLDFARLPTVTSGRTVLRIENDVAAGIARFRRLSARANNALHFAALSVGDATVLHCHESEIQQLREGYLRAALSEFASMEDAQQRDYAEHDVKRVPIKLNSNSNPLLHIFRELRNFEIHLCHSRLRPYPKDILWGKKAIPLTIDVWVVEGVTPDSFSSLNNARHYSRQQIDQMVSWFNATQAEWGVQQLFLLAVEEYCRELTI